MSFRNEPAPHYEAHCSTSVMCAKRCGVSVQAMYQHDALKKGYGLMRKALVALTTAAHARQVNNLDQLFDGL
eukprot:scaffold16014_cov62-Phaeocystis_antarctica.AAC.2